MREAEIFEPLLKNAAKKRNMDLNISSLYVSRESTWLPSLNEWNKEECENLLAKTRITVGDVFKFIASDIPSFIEKKYDIQKLKIYHIKLILKYLNIYSAMIRGQKLI